MKLQALREKADKVNVIIALRPFVIVTLCTAIAEAGRHRIHDTSLM